MKTKKHSKSLDPKWDEYMILTERKTARLDRASVEMRVVHSNKMVLRRAGNDVLGSVRLFLDPARKANESPNRSHSGIMLKVCVRELRCYY